MTRRRKRLVLGAVAAGLAAFAVSLIALRTPAARRLAGEVREAVEAGRRAYHESMARSEFDPHMRPVRRTGT